MTETILSPVIETTTRAKRLFIMLFIGIAAVTAASYYAFREAHLVTDDSRFQATVNHFSTHASLGCTLS